MPETAVVGKRLLTTAGVEMQDAESVLFVIIPNQGKVDYESYVL